MKQNLEKITDESYLLDPEEIIELTESSDRALKSITTVINFSEVGLDKIAEKYNNGTIDKPHNYFKDQIIIDFGAGTTHQGYMLARNLGAKAYIAVEPQTAEQLKEAIATYLANPQQEWENNNPLIPYAVYDGDMLNFLSRIKKDNSVSAIFSWIDQDVIPEPCNELVTQLKRVLHPKGAILSNHSNIELKYSGLKQEEISEKVEIYRQG